MTPEFFLGWSDVVDRGERERGMESSAMSWFGGTVMLCAVSFLSRMGILKDVCQGLDMT